MVMFDWLVEPPSMKGEWKCASIMPGVQCAMTLGVVLMLQWFAGNMDMHTLDVSLPYYTYNWGGSGIWGAGNGLWLGGPLPLKTKAGVWTSMRFLVILRKVQKLLINMATKLNMFAPKMTSKAFSRHLASISETFSGRVCHLQMLLHSEDMFCFDIDIVPGPPQYCFYHTK